MVDVRLQIGHNVSMNITPIQVMNEGVLIPTEYLGNAREFEFELRGENVLVRPKIKKNGHANGASADISNHSDDIELLSDEEMAELKAKYPWIGLAKGLPPDLSERVEEILLAEVDPRSGYTTKEPLTD